jgi:flagellar assembly factor FliW
MIATDGIPLKGRIIGFEEYENYALQEAFGPDSPFRVLKCLDSGISFLVVNPYHLVDEYNFDVEDDTLAALSLTDRDIDRLAVLCIARYENETIYVNLRSPLLINTEEGRFLQAILPNEGYPVSAPMEIKA